MKKVSNLLLGWHAFVYSYLKNCPFKKGYLLFFIAMVLIVLYGKGQTLNYFGSSGNIGANVWSTNPAGPYTSPLNTSGGAIIYFENAATVTGATIDIKGINATANVTSWIGGGTLGTGGTIATITVANGITLNMFSQVTSVAAGTGFIKLGAGVLALSTGSAYQAGFTLNDGTIIVGGVNALGGNTLYLNGGIVASNADRDLSGKYPGGIYFGGNVQFGDIAGLANNTAGFTFNNTISLGAANRTFTIGNSGTTTFGGVISGTNGFSITKNVNGSGIIDINHTGNTFSGSVNLIGGLARFAADGSFGNATNLVVLDGGKLLTNSTFSMLHNLQLGTTAGTGINVAAGILTIDANISDKTTMGCFTKFGSGTLVLTNANTFTGTTYIDAVGGNLELNRPGGNTIPTTNNVVVNGGVFKISSNQTLNDLSLTNGNLTIDNGVTLTINGTFDYFQPATITLNGSGKIVYGPAATLKYSGSIGTITTELEFPLVNGPPAIICNNTGGITLAFSRTVTGSVGLTAGTFTIAAGALLDLNGAAIHNGGGFLAGNSIGASGSDLTIRGITGGMVTLPTYGKIGLRNVTIGGTRMLALDGINNLVLSGTLFISNEAIFDNGGESQITDGGSPVIIIDGTFITRDLEGFSGTNAAIPGINPLLNTACTVEYGRSGNQSISIRSDYQNLRFTGGGIKTHSVANSIAPIAGTVFIPDATTLDVSNNTFGSVGTNFTMANGRFRVSGTGTKPDMDGTYNLSGSSVIEFYNSGTAVNETIRGKNGAAVNIDYNKIEVTGNKVGNSNANITLNANGIFIVKTGGIFEINDNSIIAALATSGQSVIVENNATFLCGNNRGFNGFTSTITDNSAIHANISNITLNNGSTIRYTRAGDQPITNTSGLVYAHLTLSGSGIKIAPSDTLTINGNFSKNTDCLFDANNGRVIFNNSTAIQTISSVIAPYFSFFDLTNRNTSITGLNFTNNISISHQLELANNSKLNITTADITLLSSATSSAWVAEVPATASITYNGTGRWAIERFFPAARTWRLITSPLSSENTPTTIFSQWQNNGIYTPGKGTFITGSIPDQLINGLDESYFNNYSMKSYQNNTYVNVGNTQTPLSKSDLKAANIGYFIFVRGDRRRNPDNTVFPNTNATTLSSRGKLQTGTQTFPGFTRTISGPRNFALIGNPYPSPVNFNSLNRVNLLRRFIVWDPKINQVGAYVYLDDPDNDGVYSINPSSPGGQDLNIQSGQAFFVETDAAIGPSSISFEESNKSSTNNQGMFSPISTLSSFRSSLYSLNSDSTATLADANLVEFNDRFNDAVDFQDALKFTNLNETFGLLRYGTTIAVERRPGITKNDTLFFNLGRITPRNYQFRFEPNRIDSMLCAFLEDSYTLNRIPINLTSTGIYNFSVHENSVSAAANRFRIVFGLAVDGPLPVSFTSVNAWKQGIGIAVEWIMENEQNICKYEIEKSEDGVDFSYVQTIVPTRGNPNNLSYFWQDNHPVKGYNYYRIRSVDKNGRMEYSRIVNVKMGNGANGIRVMVNPVTDGCIDLEIINMTAGGMKIRLIDIMGQILLQKTICNRPGISIEHLRPESRLAAGIYHLVVEVSGKENITFRVIML